MNNKNEIKKELYAHQGGKCFFCGEKLQIYNSELDYVYPPSLGGESTIDNLVLRCPNCNRQIGNKMPFQEIEFNYYIFQLLQKREDFRNVKQEALISSKSRYRADILAEQKIDNKWQKVLIELKSIPTFTRKRFNEILNQLLAYKAELNEEIKIVLAFPGIMPQEDYSMFKKHNIEIWDREIIRSIFKNEIEQIDNKLFQKYFTIKKYKTNIEIELLNELKNIQAGRTDWSKYQKHIEKILDYLFGDTLSAPIIELPDKYGVNRRDFILRNYCEKGFWSYLRDKYNADFIVIDAKNYKEKIKKNQVLQITNYLKVYGTGLFGMIISRNGEEDSASYQTRRDKWILEKKMLIILSDDDMEKMVLAKASSNQPEEIIKQKIEEFRLEM